MDELTVRNQLAVVARQLSAPITTPKELGIVTRQLHDLWNVVDELKSLAKRRVLDLLQSKGQKVTEKGTMRLSEGGWEFEARPNRTGYDPKKFEALLRAKGAELGKYMMPTISYKINPERVIDALTDSVLTKAELETCRYDEAWAVQTPKILGDDNARE